MQQENSAWGKKWPAPAKINLLLNIIGQRADGYHLLQTVFQLVDWCDWLTFHSVDTSSITLRNSIFGVSEATNLAIQAANLLRQETGGTKGVCIEIEKNLPLGGGLGGGSSDAATTLLVLNHLWGLDLTVSRLMQLGLQLGADVPVFVNGYAAWAEGVGEKLVKIDIPEKWLIMLKPDCSVSTKEIFSSKNLTRDSKPIKIVDFINGQQQNDCLEVVCGLYPQVKQALLDLSAFSVPRLTGTGACVFAQFDSKASAQIAYKSLSNNWQVYLVKGLNKSPLLEKLYSNFI